MRRAFIVAAARTVIAPKGGLHAKTPVHSLGGAALQAVWQTALGARPTLPEPDLVILGNALAAGGNVARRCSLTTFSEAVPALTIDTQCCSGLDAVGWAASLVASGQASVVVAGGVESASQAPLRAVATSTGPQFYAQAPFTPWPDRDPDVLAAAQDFARTHRITRQAQESWAIASHARAVAHQRGKPSDPFTRVLTERTCAKAKPLFGESPYALTACTVAPIADAAAVLLVVSESLARNFAAAIEIIHYCSTGVNPASPAYGGALAAEQALSQLASQAKSSLASVELMESFAAQVIRDASALRLPLHLINRQGGLLAKGHPIGASGAILAGNLFEQLRGERKGAFGLAAIPAAGGLGSAMVLKTA